MGHDCHTQSSNDVHEQHAALREARRELRMALQDALAQLEVAMHSGDNHEDVAASIMAYELAAPVKGYMRAVHTVEPDAMEQAVARAHEALEDAEGVSPPAMQVVVIHLEGGDGEPQSAPTGTPVAPFSI